MKEPQQKDHAAALATIDRLRWHVLLFLGLAGWTVADPPPGRWMPVAVFLLFASAVVVLEIILYRQRRNNPRQQKPPADAP